MLRNQVGSSNDLATFSLLYCRSSAEIITSRTPSAEIYLIVYYVMRSKNEVLCVAAGRLAAERSEADKPAKAKVLLIY
jgi:hypothetical protein